MKCKNIEKLCIQGHLFPCRIPDRPRVLLDDSSAGLTPLETDPNQCKQRWLDAVLDASREAESRGRSKRYKMEIRLKLDEEGIRSTRRTKNPTSVIFPGKTRNARRKIR